MSDEQQQVSNQISIQDLELSLEVYQIESDKKLQKLQELFNQKKTLDLRQAFYQERSSLQVKFQNIIGDLTEFLINQEVPSTQKLRKTFYRILQSPLLLLFKVSRFEIFNLRLNAFDIQLEPIDAISELAKLLYKNIDDYVSDQKNQKSQYLASVYESYENFLEHAKINLIQDQIFILYSYLRKGAAILKKKLQDKIKIIEIFSTIQQKIISTLLKNQDAKTLKQMSILNYEIYLLENGFDVLCFYLKVPFKNIYREIFKELQALASKAKTTCNYDIFINIFVKFNQQILNKISNEKVEEGYIDFIESIALVLLELWGCRICQFRQFFWFFRALFTVHPNQKQFLQKCLKHTPNLSQDDISLIRANYRQNVENKNVQLLSLLKKVSLDDINQQLNTIYHQILYNLDFQQESKENIIELLTLVNGNSSIEGLILTVQKAFKQWNHTIDFNNSLKFIESEFNLPKNISGVQAVESIRLFTNLCILESKGFTKQFQQLVGKGTINKVLIGMCKLLLSSQQDVTKFIKTNSVCQTFIVESFKFLQNTLPSNSNEWQQLLYLFANCLQNFSIKQNQQEIQKLICRHIELNLQNYRLGKLIRIVKKIFEFSKQPAMLNFIVNLLMKQAFQKSKQNKSNRFIGKNIKGLQKQVLTQQEAAFLKQFACVKNDFIQIKQPSCFKLTQLQVITNPIQFQKSMDNYYFTLDSNSKRFVQFIAEEWANEVGSENQFYSQIIQILISQYPVSLPILCNIRIKPNQNSKDNVQYRFVEFLVNQLLATQKYKSKQILSLIINTDTIKYRNGKDYIIEEIIPMITKRCLTLINSGSLKTGSNNLLTIEIYQILAFSLQKFPLNDLKIDTIHKSLLKINFQLQNSKDQKVVSKLSECFHLIMKIFFRKKQNDIKKKGLEQVYQKFLWNQIRSYNRPSTANNEPTKPVQTQPPVINQQIMVSPYTLSQQYNNDEYKIRKSETSTKKIESETKPIKFTQVLSSLNRVEVQKDLTNSYNQNQTNPVSQIDLSKMKYSIQLHLGTDQVHYLENKENWSITQKQTKKSLSKEQNTQKQITFVQYYLRQLSHPQINEEIVLKSILSYLKNQIQVSLIWGNPKNLQKLFPSLIILLDFITANNSNLNIDNGLKNQSQQWKNLINYVNQNKLTSLKQIFSFFSQLGYTNLWGQNYKSFSSVTNILKSLQIKVIQQDSFLSVLLKRSLQCQYLNQIKIQLNVLFDKIFSTRPAQQISLMYKVGIDKNLLNLIMKSLQIKNLSNISFLFHSNFNNLRLYTDQLQEGLKALNMASKTRSYNEYIQLSKQIEDEQFLGPMKLFQQNFGFFIKIQKQGYNFKKNEQKKLCLQRLTNVIRQYSPEHKQKICKQCDKLIQQYQQEIQKLQISIANRVKSFYLVTKLRDLSYQNALSIHLINQILRQKKVSTEEILKQINKVEIFTLLMKLHKELVRFDNSWNNNDYFQKYNNIDQQLIEKQISLCTTRRFSHSMNKIYERCDIQLDQIIQRCIDQLKMFFSTPEGLKYLEENSNIIFPAFLVKSFIQGSEGIRSNLISDIKISLSKNSQHLTQISLNLKKGEFITQFITQVREINKKIFYSKNILNVNLQGQTYSLDKFLQILMKHMIANQTLVWTKSKQSQFLTFNKYKSSEATLEEIEALGYLLSYCIYHKISLVQNQTSLLPFHNSIIAAISFNIIDVEDLLHVDFKIWEDVKRILSIQDSKPLNLNFSYIFQDVKTLKSQRIQLIDKGASKKVNNLNRDQYCDSIVCHVLYKNISLQMQRLLQSILSVIPKQLLSCQRISEIYPLFYNKLNYEKIMKMYLKKLSVITPELILREEKRIQNLRDYQNIQWATEIILESPDLRKKYWKDQSNLFIMTIIGPKSSLKFIDQTLIIEHFQSKQAMALSFKSLT